MKIHSIPSQNVNFNGKVKVAKKFLDTMDNLPNYLYLTIKEPKNVTNPAEAVEIKQFAANVKASWLKKFVCDVLLDANQRSGAHFFIGKGKVANTFSMVLGKKGSFEKVKARNIPLKELETIMQNYYFALKKIGLLEPQKVSLGQKVMKFIGSVLKR